MAEKLQVTFSLVTSDRMKALNKLHKGKDFPTDVLSFQLNEDTSEGTYLLGDVVICKEEAEKQAKEHNISYEEEVSFLAAHGVMHLMGLHHE